MAAGRLLRTKISTPASGDFTIILRVGINLGDVIHDDARIYGDGINITARLETLAEPGGVLVSSTVYDHVRGKLPITFADAGDSTPRSAATRCSPRPPATS